MKERPIVFNGETVRAILDGRKTQTRRPYKGVSPTFYPSASGGCWGLPIGEKQKAPLGTVGDRLWVRETFYWEEGSDKTIEQVAYRASNEMPPQVKAMGCRWTPSIHMPRWASRIDLEITRVWVERVQDITEEDAKAEGIVESEIGRLASRVLANYKMQTRAPAILQFAELWKSIYGTWDANPWVWAYEFRRIKP